MTRLASISECLAEARLTLMERELRFERLQAVDAKNKGAQAEGFEQRRIVPLRQMIADYEAACARKGEAQP